MLTEGHWPVASLKEYHADTECVSHSALEVLRDSVSAYHAQYVMGKRETKQSPEMALGTALHAMVFEPEKFNDLIAVGPNEDKVGKSGKAAWLIFETGINGRTVITHDQMQAVLAMYAALRASPIAGPLLFYAAGKNEHAIRWQDNDTGIWLKCSFDRLLLCGIDINLKTSRNPSPASWAKDAHNFGYHRQSELYRRGKTKLIGPGETLHIVVGSKPPHAVGVFELGVNEMLLAKEENDADLAKLAACREIGIWTDQWQKDITEITFPRYAFTNRNGAAK